MPPAPKRDCAVILLDVNCPKDSKSTRALLKIALSKQFTDSKDLVRFVFVNCKTTKNRYGYKNITELEGLNTYDAANILVEMDNNEGTSNNSNWLTGLLAGLKCLKYEFAGIKNVITYQLLFITDFGKGTIPIDTSDKDIQSVIQIINDFNVHLYIVESTMASEPPFILQSRDDVDKWMEHLVPQQKNTNFQMIKEIIDGTSHTVFSTPELAFHLFWSYKNDKGSQPWTVPLTVGNNLKISTSTRRILKQEPLLRMKAEKLNSPWQWVAVNDETIEVNVSDIVDGISRHGKFVPIVDKNMFKADSTRCFDVLGFTKADNIPEYYMVGGGSYLVSPPPEGNELFEILVETLAQENKYIVTKRVYANNYNPKFSVLIPQTDTNPKTFLLADLPYTEDIQFEYHESSVGSVPRIQPKQEIYDFLDSINVNSSKCKISVPLAPNMMIDCNSCEILNAVGDKYLESKVNLRDVEFNVVEKNVRCGDSLSSVKTEWIEREIPKIAAEDMVEDEGSDDDFEY